MPSTKLEDLISAQEITAGLILRFWDNLKKLGQANLTQAVFQTRLNTLDEYWKQFLARHFEIMRLEGASKTDYALADRFGTVEESRMVFAANITYYLTPPPTAASTDAHHSKAQGKELPEVADSSALYRQIQLPKLALPTFDGDQLAWENFRDLYKSLVHDVAGIPNVQKLQHLKANLTGEAAELIRNVPMTEAGYSGAWSELEQRYDNQRIILFSHMRNLLSCPGASKSSSSEIKRLLGVSNQAIRAFESLGRPVDKWDDWLVHLLVQRMDSTTRMQWETSLADSRDFPTYKQLSKFLENRIRALEAANVIGTETRAVTQRENSVPGARKPRTAVHVASTSREKAAPPCPLCKGNHSMGYCNRFKKISPSKRREQVRQINACLNCLRADHTVDDCPSERRCMICSLKHHTFLHCPSTAGGRADTRPRDAAHADTDRQERAPSTSASIHTMTTSSTVLLSTAQVQLEAPDGRSITVRALLDQGAEASFISEWAAQALQLPKQRVRRSIIGAQNVCTGVATAAVDVTVRSRHSPGSSIPVHALVLRTLTGVSPARKVTLRHLWDHLHGLVLADPDYATPLKIDAILGADIYGLLLENDLRKGSLDSPSAQLTIFGWVLYGPAAPRRNLPNEENITSLLCRDCEPDNDILRRFWELEEIGDKPIPSEQDDFCEIHFQNTHSRDDSGRYVVRLPFRKEEDCGLGPSRQAAVKILLQNERRLEKATSLRQKYTDFMEEYAALGHMEPVPTCEITVDDVAYLPHHGVTKTHDPQAKIRVVFDASFKTLTGYSLNDILLPGPKLQNDLWVILLRWRQFRVAFTADIVKMFRQIRIHPDDADWQRIVWRSNPGDRICDYRLTTVAYGTAPAPFLALRTLRQLASDERHRFPRGAEAVAQHSYVDDILVGADDEMQALDVKRQLTQLMRAGGFELSKWASNLSSMTPLGTLEDKQFALEDGPSTLGLRWNPSTDTFRLRVDPSAGVAGGMSKRSVLSTIARLYDPLGWAAPVLITGKIFIQNLWLRGLDWDQALPDDLRGPWEQFCTSLVEVEEITIPRWVHTLSSNRAETTLHGFCDASQRAYAAAVYLRVSNSSGKATVHLLVAKTKVAPVKTVSIPRLELCGAVLLARLMATVINGMSSENTTVVTWSDSTVTLAWIRSHASRWKPFIANRVAEIQSTLPASSWRHVGTASNPADAATRGLAPSELLKMELWWHGPSWLSDPPASWPSAPQASEEAALEEERTPAVIMTVATRNDDLSSQFSSLTRLLRVTVLCLRFHHNLRRPLAKQTGPITAEELSAALKRWVGLAQQTDFADELEAMRKGSTWGAKSRLRNLRPFLDDLGLLRVGGRLHGALLPYDERHPWILAKSSHLSLLLVRDAHCVTLHGGPQLTRSHLQRRFWIVQGNSLVRTVTRSCVRCARFRSKMGAQGMGSLPPSRTTPARPFLSTGVDYAGPLHLRLSKGRGTKSYKGYICLFVCLASKAVHLEAVSDMTSAAFIAAYKRFVSRRGRCTNLVSDNGSCFRGADSELKALFKAASHFYQDTSSALANEGVSWKFIPPYAPHFGGLWEAGVKSVKYHLRRVIGEQKLTFEELSTLLCQIEACLNSRPLYPLSNDAEDLAALTPGHLLIGEPLTAIREPDTSQLRQNALTNWKLLTKMRDHFWHRWSQEYIHQLHAINKWQIPKENLKEGALVLLKDEQLPPAKWPMGRVVQLHCGPDGLARVVSLKTIKGVVKRPLVKICPLPLVG